VLAGLTIWTNYVFIPIYGINGAAMASMISYVTINLLRLFFVQWLYRMQPFAWSSVWVTGIAIIALGASYLVPYLGNLYLDILLRSLLITAIYMGLMLSLRVYPDMNQWLLTQWRRLT